MIKNELTVTPKFDKAEEVKTYYMQFGWELQEEEEMGDTVKLVFKRDRYRPDFWHLYRMEKECKKIQKKVPIPLIVWLILGSACIVCYYVLKDKIKLPSLFWVGVTFCYSIALFYLIMFIALKINKKKILKKTGEYGGLISGSEPNVPFEINVMPYIEGQTYLIRENFKQVLKNKRGE